MRAWRALITLCTPTTLEVLGLAAIVMGVGLVYLPAAFIVGGVGAVLWARGAELEERNE